MNFVVNRQSHTLRCLMAILLLAGINLLAPVAANAQVAANTGNMEDSIVGNDNTICNDVGVCGSGENINNNQNNLSTGNNQNANQNTNVVSATQQYSGVNGGSGGSSALVLPRNPLSLPNAALGRSNFGLQFGVQNNPGLQAMTGGDNALGWFLQGGVTIPFGKIPDALANPKNMRLDDIREQNMDKRRLVFADVEPKGEKKLSGKVVGLNAYNYSTLPSGKLDADSTPPVAMMGGALPALPVTLSTSQPRVLALEPAEIFSRPLNTGNKIAVIEVGREYPYLGHTNSGWVKILLPDGTSGWTSTHLEYIKSDYTQVDTLAIDPSVHKPTRTAHIPHHLTAAKGVKTGGGKR